MPDGISNINPQLMKLAQQYHDCNVRSGLINDERTQIRENVGKLQEDPKAFQVAVRMSKEMTTGERSDFTGSLERILGALDGHEADLFGASEIAARDKRAAKRAAKAAAEADPGDKTAPDSPRGDPAKGGAGGVDGKKPAKDAKPKAVEPAVAKRRGRPPKLKVGELVQAQDKPAADVQAQEQQEGGALLDGALAATKDGAAADLAGLPDVSGDGLGIDTADMPELEEDGDAMIRRVSAQKNAELEARGGMNGMAPIDASGDGEPVENSGDGVKPMSQSEQAAARRQAAGLN